MRSPAREEPRMAGDAEVRVLDVLAALEALVADIAPLRERVGAARRGLALAVRDYDKVMHALNDEATALAARRAWLQTQLAWTPDRSTSRRDVHTGRERAPAVEPVLPPPPLPDALRAPTPFDDPRAERKRALADHVFYLATFADADEEDAVKQRITAVLADPAADLGDMLETLAWGPIWKARKDSESPEAQLARLEGWRGALDERLAYWRTTVAALDRDEQRYLFDERTARGPDGWRAYLRDLADEQRAENAELARAVATLERQWAGRQAAPGTADA